MGPAVSCQAQWENIAQSSLKDALLFTLCNKFMTVAWIFERKMLQQDSTHLGFFCFSLLSTFFEDSRHKNSQFTSAEKAAALSLFFSCYRDLQSKLPF